MKARSIRAGMGLGDSLYLQSVARHLVARGERLSVCSTWPEVFLPLPVQVEPFRRLGVDICAHYTMRKSKPETTQFQDCCIQAGIREPVALQLDWGAPTNPELVDRLRQYGKPIVCVQLPRAPMGRTDGFGKSLLPDCRVIQRLIDGLRGRALLVQIGAGAPLFNFTGIDVDLANKTTVSEMLDVASVADAFLGYCSFLVPLAESFSRPALFVWSSRGLRDGQNYIRQITPKKILHKPTSRFVIDDWPSGQILGALDGLL